MMGASGMAAATGPLPRARFNRPPADVGGKLAKPLRKINKNLCDAADGA